MASSTGAWAPIEARECRAAGHPYLTSRPWEKFLFLNTFQIKIFLKK